MQRSKFTRTFLLKYQRNPKFKFI